MNWEPIALSIVFRVLVCAALLVGWSSRVEGESANSEDYFLPRLRLASCSLPVPPQQIAPWIPSETSLPREFVSATNTLFRLGLADPRGCEYREIKVVVGGLGGAGMWSMTVSTHGWVIPNDKKQTQSFGVCWNGLTYPLSSIGGTVDLRADTATATKAKPRFFQQGGAWVNGVPPHFEDMGICNPAESRSISIDSPLPIKACLLLRLGEAELAEKLWHHWTSRLRSFSSRPPMLLSIENSVEPNKAILNDPYLVLANCWTVTLFNRAVAAHMRGDDEMAMVSAAVLDKAWPFVTAEAGKRGFHKPKKDNDRTPYLLIDADRVRELLSDQRRRANDRRQGTGPPVLLGDFPDPVDFGNAMKKELQRCPNRAKRIDVLVRELEEASFDLGSDQILVDLLTNEGEEAIAPLNNCIKNDTRLSRSLREGERFPVGVSKFAARALQAIAATDRHGSCP